MLWRPVWGNIAYLANSTNASLAAGEQSFFTNNTFDNGLCQIKDRRSVLRFSVPVRNRQLNKGPKTHEQTS